MSNFRSIILFSYPLFGILGICFAANANSVRVVYLTPSDKSYRPEYEENLRLAVTDLRGWFAEELGGTTFSVVPDSVEWYQTSHPTSWYQTDPASASFAAGRYWESVLSDAFQLTGGKFYDNENRWLFYIDADHLAGQYTGGTNSVALMPANDLRGLAGDQLVAINPGDSTTNPGFDRWVGGMGHELGHAMGLQHPADSPGGPDDSALMYWGYLNYPATYLREPDKAHILSTGFGNQDAADYNGDGLVDLTDYETWKFSYRSNSVVSDGNFDGIVDAADYTIWRDKVQAVSLSSPIGVPEPASVLMIAVLTLAPVTITETRKVQS